MDNLDCKNKKLRFMKFVFPHKRSKYFKLLSMQNANIISFAGRFAELIEVELLFERHKEVNKYIYKHKNTLILKQVNFF